MNEIINSSKEFLEVSNNMSNIAYMPQPGVTHWDFIKMFILQICLLILALAVIVIFFKLLKKKLKNNKSRRK